jgi:hypothetical protein
MEQDIEDQISDLIAQAEMRKSAIIAWVRTQPLFSNTFIDRIEAQDVSGWFCSTLRGIISDLETQAKPGTQSVT